MEVASNRTSVASEAIDTYFSCLSMECENVDHRAFAALLAPGFDYLKPLLSCEGLAGLGMRQCNQTIQDTKFYDSVKDAIPTWFQNVPRSRLCGRDCCGRTTTQEPDMIFMGTANRGLPGSMFLFPLLMCMYASARKM